MPNALIVADDLTGALDTGHGFAARGRGVYARLADGKDGFIDETDRVAGGDGSDADVLAVDTDSRDIDAEAAARTVRATVERTDAGITYKKVDSTLRGNVVAEVDAALAASDAALAVVAPAFPGTGRRTRDGIHRVEGEPLADAGYGIDESSLPRFFAASEHAVDHLSLSTVAAGADAVTAALRGRLDAAETSPIVVCDATESVHLAAIATGANALDVAVLYVGSGGLAEHVAVPGEPVPPSPPSRTGSGVLGIVGSVNPRTLDQLAAVPTEHVVRLDPGDAVRDPEAAAKQVVPQLTRRIRRHGRAVLTAAFDTDDVESAETVAKRLSTDGPEIDAGERVARALAAGAKRTVADGGAIDPAGLFLTGGDVARETLEVLGTTVVGLTGRDASDGVPEGWIVDGSAANTRVVTKAGGFGDRRTIVNCLRLLDDNHD